MKSCKSVCEHILIYLIFLPIISICANGYILFRNNTMWIAPAVIGFILANILPGFINGKIKNRRLKLCAHGVHCLRLFLISCLVSIGAQIYYAVITVMTKPINVLISVLVCIIVEAVVFWNGIISVYGSSTQLGIKLRVIGILCGMIPIVNIVVLFIIINTANREVIFETEKEYINKSREKEQICKTKYPILLVHGVFFRDFKYLNYWGRIPGELEKNGATVFYGNHHSAASVDHCAKELTARIKDIVEETGCEKVNVIAHSKGGLDIRCAMSEYGADKMIASVTTINTPHRGCNYADYLLDKAPEPIKEKVENAYNSTALRLGDESPDFIAAVDDLTLSACEVFNEKTKDPEDVFCQSVGSKLNRGSSGKFPTNFTYHVVKLFDGPNDGLVAADSFKWGTEYTYLTVKGKRGISHGDVIDLNRENLEEFDVREFYVNLVADLKNRGY